MLKPTLFAVLMWAASAAGAVPIPGTPVPITLQTFVVMLAALMLPWKQAGAAMLMYLAAGAVGLPVFAGGASTMALVGPSAGFLIGFLPAAAQGQSPHRFAEARCADRRTLSVRLRRRLHCD